MSIPAPRLAPCCGCCEPSVSPGCPTAEPLGAAPCPWVMLAACAPAGAGLSWGCVSAAPESTEEPCSGISHLSPSISLTANSGKLEGVPLSRTTL